MTIMALDVGERRIGVAVSDDLMITAQGIEVIARAGLQKDLIRIGALIRDRQIKTIVLGLPLNMDGSAGSMVDAIKEFGEQLNKAFVNIAVDYWDERLSTAAARRSLLEADVSRARRRQVIDKMAAMIILQGYMDRKSVNKPSN